MPNGQNVPQEIADATSLLFEARARERSALLRRDQARAVVRAMMAAGLRDQVPVWQRIEMEASATLGIAMSDRDNRLVNLTRLEGEAIRVARLNAETRGASSLDIDHLSRLMRESFRTSRQVVETAGAISASRQITLSGAQTEFNAGGILADARSIEAARDVAQVAAGGAAETARAGIEASVQAPTQIETLMEMGLRVRTELIRTEVQDRTFAQTSIAATAQEAPARASIGNVLRTFFFMVTEGKADVPGIGRQITQALRTLPAFRLRATKPPRAAPREP